MPASPPAPRPRWWLLPAGMLLGLAVSTLTPGTAGCIYHDTCIKVTSPGTDYCRNVALAKRWPVGSSFEEDAEPILRPDGASPRGCRCYNDAQLQIWDDGAPACVIEGFMADLEQAARQECQDLVPPGYDHNCWTVTGPQASIVEGESLHGPGACIGNCEYGSPPSGGSCPDPTPYECATGGGGDEGCDEGDDESDSETGPGDSGVDETGSATSGGGIGDIDEVVDCVEQSCEIDEAFARDLYLDPSPLLDQSARLVYHPKLRRHILKSVEPGSLAHALGLRTDDVLESIDGMIIDGLDTALQAYAGFGHADTLDVRVKRGARWLDFTYTFVP